ncbi:MAG: pilus assembly protein N-terminal domain-containing protein [Myxococcota bacterium]|nr:pilus assembly protein N-terminal domain-containing protein [Myxococcota bacterium]
MKAAAKAIVLGMGLAVGLGATLAPQTAQAQEARKTWLEVEVGQSTIQKSGRPFHRVLISNNEVAEVRLLEEGQFQIRGKEVGSTDLWIWYRDDVEHPSVIELTVHRDLSDLVRRIGDIVGDNATPPRAYPMEGRIVLEGSVADLPTLERIAAVAAIYDPEFVNLLTVRGDHQVQLEVTFAEVSRTATREMGLNWLWGSETYGPGVMTGSVNPGTTGDRASITMPDAVDGDNFQTLVNSGTALSSGSGAFAIPLLLGEGVDLAAILSVLEQHDITKIKAEPTLVVLSGQEAELLAGGEIPVPVAQNNNRITLEFKEYGVKLQFVPTVLGGEVIDMRMYFEVSEVDNSTSTRITGIEIPGFLSRKTSTHLRVRNGMTFAVAGMISEGMRYTKSSIPILGEIPILGSIFRYTKHERDETELMIFVTPRLVRPMAPDEVPAPPGAYEDNNPNDFEFFLLGMDHRAGSRTWDPSGPVGMQR